MCTQISPFSPNMYTRVFSFILQACFPLLFHALRGWMRYKHHYNNYSFTNFAMDYRASNGSVQTHFFNECESNCVQIQCINTFKFTFNKKRDVSRMKHICRAAYCRVISSGISTGKSKGKVVKVKWLQQDNIRLTYELKCYYVLLN